MSVLFKYKPILPYLFHETVFGWRVYKRGFVSAVNQVRAVKRVDLHKVMRECSLKLIISFTHSRAF